MKIAISGTRNFNSITEFQKKMLKRIINNAKVKKHEIIVGDCPTGIDQITIEHCKKIDIKYKVYYVTGARTPLKLRERTISLVKDCNYILSFPKDLNSIRSGTWLATFQGVRDNKNVFVCIENNYKQLPFINEIAYWDMVGVLHKPVKKEGQQMNLFNTECINRKKPQDIVCC